MLEGSALLLHVARNGPFVHHLGPSQTFSPGTNIELKDIESKITISQIKFFGSLFNHLGPPRTLESKISHNFRIYAGTQINIEPRAERKVK